MIGCWLSANSWIRFDSISYWRIMPDGNLYVYISGDSNAVHLTEETRDIFVKAFKKWEKSINPMYERLERAATQTMMMADIVKDELDGE
jgi:hypothetical protein